MKEKSHKAVSYVCMIPVIAEIGREHGYAIGVHGSINRDLDLIAVPWIEEADEPEVLIEAIRKYFSAIIIEDGTPAGRYDPETESFVPAIIETPSVRPHGRLAWNIHLEAGCFIDISVFPKRAT